MSNITIHVLQANPDDEYLCARLLHEASAIPNRTHKDSASLTEPKVVQTREFNRTGESLGKKPAVFEKLAGTRLKQFRSEGVKEIFRSATLSIETGRHQAGGQIIVN